MWNGKSCEAAKKPDPRVERPKKSSAAGCDSGQTPATSTTPTDEPKATPGFALRAHLLMNVTIQPVAAKNRCFQDRPDPPLGCNRWFCLWCGKRLDK